MAMLAKDPAARPTAAQVRAELTRLAGAAGGSGRSRRRATWAAVIAAVVVLGAGGWYAASALGGPSQDTGRYAAAPDPCTLLGDAEAARLMKGAVERASTRPGECQWQLSSDSGRGNRLIVRAWAERPTQDLGGPEVAQRRFTSERSTRAAAEGTSLRTSHGKVREVEGLGEAAIIQNAFEFYINSTETGKSDSVLLFRTSNLLGEVIWHREEVTRKVPADKDTAIAAARIVFAALPK